MSIPTYQQIRVFEDGKWSLKTVEEFKQELNNYELVGQFDGYPLRDPYYVRRKKEKSLEQRITEYLDKAGVLNENMRRDLTAMIKEEEEK